MYLEITLLSIFSGVVQLLVGMMSLPQVLIEATYSGAVIVVPAIDDIPDLIDNGKNGFLVNTLNAYQYYEACNQILIDDIIYKKLIENSNRFITNYIIDKLSLQSQKKIWYNQLSNIL